MIASRRLEPLAAVRPAPVAARRLDGSRPPEGHAARRVAALGGPGRPLDAATRAGLEPRFGRDLSAVRIHAGPAAALSARALGAEAFAAGHHISFAAGRYDPGSAAGRDLLAHEVAHVVQQTGSGLNGGAGPAALEAEADGAARAVTSGRDAPTLSAAGGVQRRVEMRDVGRGEASGMARLPELIQRLNTISTALIFDVNGGALTVTENPYGTETEFDRQMKEFIGSDIVLPLRLSNRHGLMRDTSAAFDQTIDVDSYGTGYVDIDDLLASSDLGLQAALLHILRERSATRNYAKRIGTASLHLDVPAQDAEFQRSHRRGVQSERDLLRDFFSDPSIETIDVDQRIFRNSRRDIIRAKITLGSGRERSGIMAVDFEVRLRDGRRMTPDEYRAFLAAVPPAAAAAAP